MGDQALISPTEMRRYLFAQEFPATVLDQFELMNWNFDRILPEIVGGTLGVRRNLDWRSRAEKSADNQIEAEGVLLKLASAFLHKADDIKQKSVYGARVQSSGLIQSLRKDGFIMSGGKLVCDMQVIDISAQRTEFQQALAESKHDNKQLVLHHLKEAETFQASEQWGAAASEWRHVFEESIRGAWRMTKASNPHFSERPEKPPFRDVLLWLNQAGFLEPEEKDAFGSAFGFLSVGNHPGIKGKHVAYVSRTLASPLAHAILAKLTSWNGRSFT